MLHFQILEQCGNFRDMSLQLFSNNETFLKFRKFGNKVFMSLPIPQRSQIKRPPMRPKRAMRGRGATRRYQVDSDSDDSDDDDYDNSNSQQHNVQCMKRSMTMRKVHKRKK